MREPPAARRRPMRHALPLLGGITAETFLREHWQKRPLLIRQAVPGFEGLVSRDALLALATRDDVTSRLVLEHPGKRARWERHDGPFAELGAADLPPTHWTLLVHGLESLVPGGWELLRRFAFLPAARVDDVMVSYAAPGGSVGPHDDRYDVFLLQGPGRRRWQIARGGDRAVDPRAAIKVLARFVPEEEWLLEPGDMLYLPPGVAHHGVAEGPCFTYSIGFLAPSHQALVEGFLGYLAAALPIDPDALYRDPGLLPARAPLEIADDMVAQVRAVLDGIRWDAAAVEDFLGRFLTMPKPRVVFTPPRRPPSTDDLARRLRAPGSLELALPSRGLVRGRRIFLNGESHEVTRATRVLFEELVAARVLSLPRKVPDEAVGLLHGWLLAGWLVARGPAVRPARSRRPA